MGDAHFSLRVPKYLNVGSLGLTLAHEMLHSLDTTGRGFDSKGVLTSDFWDYNSRRNFANVSQCIIDQYQEHFRRVLKVDSRSMVMEVGSIQIASLSNLILLFLGSQVDGKFTLNENMCDIDGVNVAASAFEELHESSATTPTGDLVYLPNNPYSPKQLFFINTAQVKENFLPSNFHKQDCPFFPVILLSCWLSFICFVLGVR